MIDLNKDFGIYYHGSPIKPIYKGVKFGWVSFFKMLKYLHEDYLEIDGWRFNLFYGSIYLREKKDWNYYLPPSGLKDKIVLDVGGGCGETAKFFIENGALGVNIIEMNKECEKFLEYNSLYHNIKYRIKKFDLSDMLKDKYDLIKIDIEGYEIELLPYLNEINIDIVLESHSQYTTDKFIENGFTYCELIKEKRSLWGVTQLCRWKKY